MARTLRLTLSDGGLDVTLADGTLAYVLACALAVQHERINTRRAGRVMIEGNAAGGYTVKLSGNVSETLCTTAAPA